MSAPVGRLFVERAAMQAAVDFAVATMRARISAARYAHSKLLTLVPKTRHPVAGGPIVMRVRY